MPTYRVRFFNRVSNWFHSETRVVAPDPESAVTIAQSKVNEENPDHAFALNAVADLESPTPVTVVPPPPTPPVQFTSPQSLGGASS